MLACLFVGLSSVAPTAQQKGVATTTTSTAAPPPSQAVPSDVPTVVVGYDTPCQRAVIRAQKATMYRTEQALTAAVAQLKQQLWQWLGQERQWAPAWGRMIEELDEV
jgi:hypothetical protein